ncbi:MAG TPA: cupin domain-containing protein [Solirubrobacteraceae bacterium]|nr:cupin domain-containing protein [Solirubrobacteraceae bacterium]
MTQDHPDPSLGARLRRLRVDRGLSLSAAAELAGMSASFLSLVERGESDLALGRFVRLLECYGASMTDVVPPTAVESRSQVVRAGDEVHFTSQGERISAYLLVADAAQSLVPMIWVYEPGGAMEVLQANPTDVFSHVLEGTIVYETAQGQLELSRGDTVYVPAGQPYRFRNDSPSVARLLGCGYNAGAEVQRR